MTDKINYHEQPVMESGAETATVVKSAFCGSLRSKKFFMLDGLASEAQDYLDASNYCWCGVTQMAIGPDGNRAQPSRCTPDRACYTSALEG